MKFSLKPQFSSLKWEYKIVLQVSGMYAYMQACIRGQQAQSGGFYGLRCHTSCQIMTYIAYEVLQE